MAVAVVVVVAEEARLRAGEAPVALRVSRSGEGGVVVVLSVLEEERSRKVTAVFASPPG